MKKLGILSGLFLLVFLLSGFAGGWLIDLPQPIPPSPQRLGNAARGYTYLTTGDYVKGGIPYSAFLFGNGKQPVLLEREGLNKNIPHDYTTVKAANGEVLVAPNCLQCHAQVFEGQLVMGLGNSLVDFTAMNRANGKNLQLLGAFLKKSNPAQYEASRPFLEVTEQIAPHLQAPVRGVNVADRLAAVLVAHRDPQTFRWSATASLAIPEELIPSDTPPWWLLKKKNAMFYNGFGRGDFGRFLMASNLLTVSDTAESRQVDERMPDVLAYLYSLEPPRFSRPINADLAGKGKAVFEERCSGCHGTYGKGGSYPNLLIPQAIIQTDSMLYQSNYSNPQFVSWFNRSWFTQGSHPARLEPYRGYIAPPLDGIWISAPYLHNGSVPTLEALLDSRLRPRYWARSFDKPEYDYTAIGWKFEKKEKAGGVDVYNTDLPGYGNYGHYFGDRISASERRAVLEYLKTL
jgi:mono/diheme cytochrome c family protein